MDKGIMVSGKIRVFINGFGRIGRCAARIILEDECFELVGVNDLYSCEQMAYLLKYDSVYPRLEKSIILTEGCLMIDGHRVALFCEPDPQNMDLGPLDVDVVLQCSGIFLTQKSNLPLIKYGAKRVIVSAPPTDSMPTFIYGVNHSDYADEEIISNSSCSANAIVPLFKIIDRYFGIDTAMMSMYHSYTVYQNILDNKHYSRDIRRTRSATQNIIPLMSSAAEATGYFFPHLKGRLYAKSIRVPIPSTTLYELHMQVNKKTNVEELNQILKQEIKSSYADILDTTDAPGFSEDYVQSPYSAIVNLPFTTVVGDNLLRISAWQDNEHGYAKRLVEMAKHIA
ncbi:MAG TPA: aldehyde dehydrogenase [Sulfurovum sp.]|nr:aldehyde dehydrogenase [Sulfurovum sp.]